MGLDIFEILFENELTFVKIQFGALLLFFLGVELVELLENSLLHIDHQILLVELNFLVEFGG